MKFVTNTLYRVRIWIHSGNLESFWSFEPTKEHIIAKLREDYSEHSVQSWLETVICKVETDDWNCEEFKMVVEVLQ